MTLLAPQQSWQARVFIYKKALGLQIGKYYQVHEWYTPWNRNKEHTKGAICIKISVNTQGGFKFMILGLMKNIIRRSWNMILMPDTFIDRVNILGKYQQYILIFTNHNGRLIGDGDVELIGVDGYGNETESPLKNWNKNNLNDQEDLEEVHPEQEDQTIQQIFKVTLEPL